MIRPSKYKSFCRADTSHSISGKYDSGFSCSGLGNFRGSYVKNWLSSQSSFRFLSKVCNRYYSRSGK